MNRPLFWAVVLTLFVLLPYNILLPFITCKWRATPANLFDYAFLDENPKKSRFFSGAAKVQNFIKMLLIFERINL